MTMEQFEQLRAWLATRPAGLFTTMAIKELSDLLAALDASQAREAELREALKPYAACGGITARAALADAPPVTLEARTPFAWVRDLIAAHQELLASHVALRAELAARAEAAADGLKERYDIEY
jgi:hypothetical protein